MNVQNESIIRFPLKLPRKREDVLPFLTLPVRSSASDVYRTLIPSILKFPLRTINETRVVVYT